MYSHVPNRRYGSKKINRAKNFFGNRSSVDQAFSQPEGALKTACLEVKVASAVLQGAETELEKCGMLSAFQQVEMPVSNCLSVCDTNGFAFAQV